MNRAIVLMLTCFISSCSAFQSNIKDPLVNLFRRGSCVSIDIPPITLTPGRTDAERQLMGDDPAIERDGWLFAAPLITNRGETTEILTLTRRVYREQAILEFNEQPLRQYTRSGLLGEDTDSGKVVFVPESYNVGRIRFRSPEEMEAVRRMAEEINLSRSFLVDYFRKRESKKPSGNPDQIEKDMRAAYAKNIRSGEWVLRAGVWTKQK